jgi:hypothetical protein
LKLFLANNMRGDACCASRDEGHFVWQFSYLAGVPLGQDNYPSVIDDKRWCFGHERAARVSRIKPPAGTLHVLRANKKLSQTSLPLLQHLRPLSQWGTKKQRGWKRIHRTGIEPVPLAVTMSLNGLDSRSLMEGKHDNHFTIGVLKVQQLLANMSVNHTDV